MTKKQAILDACSMLFAQKGYKDTAISEISRITGAADGTIFHHFKNKEDLFLGVLEAAKDKVIRELERYEAEHEFSTGLDMVEGLALFSIKLAGDMEQEFLLIHRGYAYQLAGMNPVCRSHMEAIYNRFVDLFERAVLTGQEDGSIRPMPPAKAALIIFSMISGLIRFQMDNIFDIGVLFPDFLDSCRRMLATEI